ncbi:MAG TPA: FAD-binding oxidoreductase [Holophagaceae bacterium]|nr:FAD-binding oxidoreductase [Holophagaceae bacterium]
MTWTDTWRRAEVVGQRAVARGTQLTTLRLPDELPFPFEPGHVVALRMPTPTGLHRHPYTVCGSEAGARELTFVYRVIPEGRLTPTFAALAPGAVVELSGLHHNPIREEVDPEAETFVGFATSSGLGPLWGFAAKALAEGEARPLHLVVGVREEADLPLRPELDALTKAHPTFRWTPVVSGPEPVWAGLRGRITDHAPTFLARPQAAHVHLVGNMAMVKTMEAALLAAGLPARRVTKEGFFNWNAEADTLRVAELAALLRSRS